jgi:hypothetical protein
VSGQRLPWQTQLPPSLCPHASSTSLRLEQGHKNLKHIPWTQFANDLLGILFFVLLFCFGSTGVRTQVLSLTRQKMFHH